MLPNFQSSLIAERMNNETAHYAKRRVDIKNTPIQMNRDCKASNNEIIFQRVGVSKLPSETKNATKEETISSKFSKLNLNNLRKKSTSDIHNCDTKKNKVRKRCQEQHRTDEGMVTIRCKRMSTSRELEEVEIKVPVDVYKNIKNDRLDCKDFVRNTEKRKSIGNKLKQFLLGEYFEEN